MTKDYSIVFQKEKEGSPLIDLFDDFDMVCISFPFQLGFETKEVVTDDWTEEDGEDSYEPEVLKLKAYDLEAEIGYQGDDFKNKLQSFLDYLIGLDGNGVKLKVYNPHSKIGRKGLRFIKYAPNISNEDIHTFKVTFRVTDPKTNITL